METRKWCPHQSKFPESGEPSCKLCYQTTTTVPMTIGTWGLDESNFTKGELSMDKIGMVDGDKLMSHQNTLKPKDNKFHKGNGSDGKHYWLTPPDLYERLNAEFHFDFDPCPCPLPEGFDGLNCEWGSSNYVNPPFGSIIHQGKKKGPTAWVRKALEEQSKGKLVVLVFPLDKWVLMILKAIGSEVRNLGDVRWVSVEDKLPGKGTGRHIACFILRPKSL